MARTDFGNHEGSVEPEAGAEVPRGRTVVHLAGAVASVALVAYLAHWGWDLAMLDLRGVPVIHALDGPMRLQPEETGGAIISNQGLAVNAIAAGKGVAPVPDEVLLAPAPGSLQPEDTPGLPAQPPVAVPDAAEDDGFFDETAEAVASAVAGLVADSVTGPKEEAVAEGAQAIIRPAPRPEGLAPARKAGATEAAPDPVDPESIATGTRLVQFGAYDSPDEARTEWQRLATEFPELMADKAMVIQPAESGGLAFWRLRALGFADEAEARRFCAAIDTSDIHCIPVTQR